jgi:hypothetical protein
MDVYLKDIIKKDKILYYIIMASEEKGHIRLIRANTPEVDNDFFNMMDGDPKVIAARQQIEEANNAYRNRKTGNDRM